MLFFWLVAGLQKAKKMHIFFCETAQKICYKRAQNTPCLQIFVFCVPCVVWCVRFFCLCLVCIGVRAVDVKKKTQKKTVGLTVGLFRHLPHVCSFLNVSEILT